MVNEEKPCLPVPRGNWIAANAAQQSHLKMKPNLILKIHRLALIIIAILATLTQARTG